MRTHDEYDFMQGLANSSSVRAKRHIDDDGLPCTKKLRPITRGGGGGGGEGGFSSRCHDWMVVSGNCHYARDAAAFSSYRAVSATLQNNIFNPHDEMHVAGVGTVHLRVACGRTDSSNGEGEGGDAATQVLVLEGVLHIPEAVCNGFNPLLVGSSMSCHREFWEGCDRAGRPMWFGRPFAGGTRLVLGDLDLQGRGESELIEGRYYTLSLYISPEERAVLF